MSTTTRLLRELEDLDRQLQSIVRVIDNGSANMTDIRRKLVSCGNEIREADRLARALKHELRQATNAG